MRRGVESDKRFFLLNKPGGREIIRLYSSLQKGVPSQDAKLSKPFG